MLNQVDWTVTKHTNFISVSYQQFMELQYVGVFGYRSDIIQHMILIFHLREWPFRVTIHHYK